MIEFPLRINYCRAVGQPSRSNRHKTRLNLINFRRKGKKRDAFSAESLTDTELKNLSRKGNRLGLLPKDYFWLRLRIDLGARF